MVLDDELFGMRQSTADYHSSAAALLELASQMATRLVLAFMELRFERLQSVHGKEHTNIEVHGHSGTFSCKSRRRARFGYCV